MRVHAETGREALYLNQQYTIGLDGWWPHESKALLDVIYQHATQPAFTCRWRWAVGDVAFWDNRCMQHMVMADVEGHRRAMHRTTVAGEAPIASRVTLQEQARARSSATTWTPRTGSRSTRRSRRSSIRATS